MPFVLAFDVSSIAMLVLGIFLLKCEYFCDILALCQYFLYFCKIMTVETRNGLQLVATNPVLSDENDFAIKRI